MKKQNIMKKHDFLKKKINHGKVHSKRHRGEIIKYFKSNKKSKKWMSQRPDGKWVYWGHPKMQDYTQHHSKKRRKLFRKRMSGVLLKNGKRAIDKKYSPAWYSYYITW